MAHYESCKFELISIDIFEKEKNIYTIRIIAELAMCFNVH